MGIQSHSETVSGALRRVKVALCGLNHSGAKVEVDYRAPRGPQLESGPQLGRRCQKTCRCFKADDASLNGRERLNLSTG